MLARAEPSIVMLSSNGSSAAEISALAERLLAAGKTVVVIMPLLDIGFDLPPIFSNINALRYRGLFDAAFRAALRLGTEAEKKRD